MGSFGSLRKAEMAAACLVGLIGVFIAFHSFRVLKIGMPISPDAGFMPFLLGLALAVLGTIWLFSLLLFKNQVSSGWASDEGCQEEYAEDPAAGKSRKHLIGFFLILLFAFLMERAGFLFSTLLFMFLWQWLVEKASWFSLILITFITGGAMYALFKLILKIYLPAGLWFS